MSQFTTHNLAVARTFIDQADAQRVPNARRLSFAASRVQAHLNVSLETARELVEEALRRRKNEAEPAQAAVASTPEPEPTPEPKPAAKAKRSRKAPKVAPKAAKKPVRPRKRR